MEFIVEEKKRPLSNALLVLLILLSVFVAAKAINELRSGSYIDDVNRNVISVSGEGEAFAVPDTAQFTLTVQAEAASVSEAQETVTNDANKIIDFLKGEGVEEKNIKTVGYNVYPRYEYRTTPQPIPLGAPESMMIAPSYPGGSERVLAGYEVSHTLQVKVTDPKQAGEILSGVGELGADNVSGISFTIEDEDALRREARKGAIDDAREKARELAKDLGVRLGDVVSFSEGGGGYPVYYEARAILDGVGGVDQAVIPDIPAGENRITSYVTITYEIK